MDQKLMLQMLEQNADAYRVHRPATAEMDLAIFRSYCSGESAVQIAMKVPCAESTVYRALRRVKDFLNVPEQTPFMDILRKHISEHAPNYGDWDAHSVLEMLYVAYSDYNTTGPDEVQSIFHKLRLLLDDMPEKSVEQVFDMVCDLCSDHERSGFTEGVKLGVHLADELHC